MFNMNEFYTRVPILFFKMYELFASRQQSNHSSAMRSVQPFEYLNHQRKLQVEQQSFQHKDDKPITTGTPRLAAATRPPSRIPKATFNRKYKRPTQAGFDGILNDLGLARYNDDPETEVNRAAMQQLEKQLKDKHTQCGNLVLRLKELMLRLTELEKSESSKNKQVKELQHALHELKNTKNKNITDLEVELQCLKDDAVQCNLLKGKTEIAPCINAKHVTKLINLINTMHVSNNRSVRENASQTESASFSHLCADVLFSCDVPNTMTTLSASHSSSGMGSEESLAEQNPQYKPDFLNYFLHRGREKEKKQRHRTEHRHKDPRFHSPDKSQRPKDITEERIQEVFKAIDKEKVGVISKSEFVQSLKLLGLSRQQSKLLRNVSIVDKEKSNYLDFSEFRRCVLGPNQSKSMKVVALRRLFHKLDAHRLGYLSFNAFKKACKMIGFGKGEDLGRNLTAEERERLLGAEVCLWGEDVDEFNLDQRLWFRASVFAERLWADDDAQGDSTSLFAAAARLAALRMSR